MTPTNSLPAREIRLLRTVYVLATVAAAVPRLHAAWSDQGVLFPDEIYQTLEQGHRLAFGYGLVPWEFRDGARSWLVPGAVGLLMKAGSFFGLSSGLALARLIKMVVALASTLACYGAMRLAAPYSGPAGAMLTGILAATLPASVLLAGRCFSDAVSAPIVAFACLQVVEPRSRLRGTLAGALIGLAIVCRYQNGLVAIGLFTTLLGARRRSEAYDFTLALLAVVLLGALLDWATWGVPFNSFFAYLRYNLEVKQMPIGGPFYYARVAWTSNGWPTALIGLGLAVAPVRCVRRQPVLVGLFATMAVFTLIHCFIPNKQFRFLLPVLPIALAFAGIGLSTLVSPLLTVPARLLGTASALWAALAFNLVWREHRVTFHAMGDARRGGAQAVWGYEQGANILLSRAGRTQDICGLAMAGTDWYYDGGYTYLHRDVPLYPDTGALHRGWANYLVAAPGFEIGSPYRSVAHADAFILYRREGSCEAPPGDYSRWYELPSSRPPTFGHAPSY